MVSSHEGTSGPVTVVLVLNFSCIFQAGVISECVGSLQLLLFSHLICALSSEYGYAVLPKPECKI